MRDIELAVCLHLAESGTRARAQSPAVVTWVISRTPTKGEPGRLRPTGRQPVNRSCGRVRVGDGSARRGARHGGSSRAELEEKKVDH